MKLDFFIKKENTIIVVEIKDDSQINSPDLENLGKYKAAISHFNRINNYLEENKNPSRYKFTFLSPRNYDTFFKILIASNNDSIMKYNSELDVRLSQS